jgi:hypothetical protein
MRWTLGATAQVILVCAQILWVISMSYEEEDTCIHLGLSCHMRRRIRAFILVCAQILWVIIMTSFALYSSP